MENAAHIARIKIGRQPVFRVIRHADRFLIVLEAEQGDHRAKNLLACERHIFCDIAHNGGFKEGAAQRMPLAAQGDFGPFLRGVADQLLHLLDRRHIDQRPLFDTGSHSVADFERSNRARKLFRKCIIDAVLNQEPIRANAGLAHVAEFRCQRTCHRGIKVRVVEHDERRVAAEFERYLFHRGGALPHQLLADLG